MADLTKREKVYESIVQARIDACYLLALEFARTHGYLPNFETTTHITADTAHIVIPIIPEEILTDDEQKLRLRAGSIEFIRLTTDTTLFQVFIGDPVWSLVTTAGGTGGAAAAAKMISEDAHEYLEGVWLGVLGRFRSLNLVPTHRVTSTQGATKQRT